MKSITFVEFLILVTVGFILVGGEVHAGPFGIGDTTTIPSLSPTITPLTPLQLHSMCDQYPDACRSAPTVAQSPVAAPAERTRCIDGIVYHVVVHSDGSEFWEVYHWPDGPVRTCPIQ